MLGFVCLFLVWSLHFLVAAWVNTIISHTSVAPGYARGDVSGFAAGVPIKKYVILDNF